MKLLVVAVGERMPRWVDEAFADYARRFPRKARLALAEVRPEKRGPTRTVAQALAGEAKRIDAALPPGCRRVVLDERGRDVTTAALARLLEGWLAEGRDVRVPRRRPRRARSRRSSARRDLQLRLSSLTLPHALVRIVLAEQLYRALSHPR